MVKLINILIVIAFIVFVYNHFYSSPDQRYSSETYEVLTHTDKAKQEVRIATTFKPTGQIATGSYTGCIITSGTEWTCMDATTALSATRNGLHIITPSSEVNLRAH